jgi:hypothetical protein
VNTTSFTKALLGLALALNLAWHSPAVAWPEEGRAAIEPTLTRLQAGQAQQFHATLLPGRMQVSKPATQATWFVNGEQGGNDTVGRISADGKYQAPSVVPTSAIHIRAEVPEASNPALFATVLLADASRYRSESHWPTEEIAKADLQKPQRIAFDSTGHLLVLDIETGRASQFTKSGTFVEAFGRNADGGGMGGLCMVAVAPSGTVYTGDLATGPPRINVFNPKGDWQSGFGQKGSRPGMVVEPAGMAFHPNGRVYLADMDAMRISIFDAEHKFLRHLREDAPEGNRTNAPSDVAFDAAGDLFVASTYGPCQKVSADSGERLLAFAYPMPPEGMMYIDDICIDRWGNVFLAVRSAADPVESGPDHGGVASILKYTNTGDYLTTIALTADAPTRVSVAVAEDDLVYAAYSTEDAAGVEVFAQD